MSLNGDEKKMMKKKKIKRSKTSLFLFFGSICIIIGSIVAMIETLENFYLLLFGLSILLMAFALSEPEEKKSKMLMSGVSICFSGAGFWLSFLYSGITATLFALFGIFMFVGFIHSIYSLLKGDKSP